MTHMQAARPRSLQLAIVTETYPPEINGVASTMRHLVEGLAGRGHRIHLVRPRQQADRTPPGADAERGTFSAPARLTLAPGLPIPGYRGLRFGLPILWRLRRLWRRERPDVVYIATQGPLGHAALSAARAEHIPAVTGFHTQFRQYSEHYGLGVLANQIADTLRHFHNRSNATLVPTAELMADLTAEGFANVHVFGRGVDVELFSPARRSQALRTAWGCDADAMAILHVGRVAAEKNLDLALETFQAIEAVQPRARFVLVGDGPALHQLIRDHPRFVCPGTKVGEELATHYASADLFLFPSLTETFGNVVPEAMASGLPVVAFDYAAAHSSIVSGENGVTVPLGDRAAFKAAAVDASRNPQRLRAMGQEARRCAEGMSWDRVLGVVEERLLEVIRRHGGSEGRHETVAATAE